MSDSALPGDAQLTPPDAETVIPAEAGMMPSTPMRLSLLTVIPAKAGIQRRTPTACTLAADTSTAGELAVIPAKPVLAKAGIRGA